VEKARYGYRIWWENLGKPRYKRENIITTNVWKTGGKDDWISYSVQ